MSAFLCSPELIATLATRLASHTNRYGDASKIARTLAKQNVASIKALYGDEWQEDFAAYVQDCTLPARLRALELAALSLPPERVYGLCACYDYQACETPNWQSTEAHAAINALRSYEIDRLAQRYNLIPGWEFTEVEIAILSLVS
jgi:hypothetical protein